MVYHLSKWDGEDYTIYKTIKDDAAVNTISDLLNKVNWENVHVSMSRVPDYKIRTENTDPNVSLVRESYDLWLSPKGDYFEVVVEGFAKYGKISPEDSMALLAMLTAP